MMLKAQQHLRTVRIGQCCLMVLWDVHVEVMTPTRTHIGLYAYAESETSSSVILPHLRKR